MKLFLLDDVPLDRNYGGRCVLHHVMRPQRLLNRFFVRGAERHSCARPPRSGWRNSPAANSAKCNGKETSCARKTAGRAETRARAAQDRDAYPAQEKSCA